MYFYTTGTNPSETTMTQQEATFCPNCGTALESRSFEGRVRTFCPACEEFVWQNPVPVARVVVLDGDDVLFVKRGNEPDRGAWTVPGGILEVDETAPAAATRELREETAIQVKPADLELVRTGFKMDRPSEGSILSLCFAVERTRTAGHPEPGAEPDAVGFRNLEQLVAAEDARTRNVDRYCIDAARERLRDDDRTRPAEL